MTLSELTKLKELNPPDVMPQGNVGTPTKTFLNLIRSCQLPQSVIKKLGLSFPKTRTNKKYGMVPFSYGGEVTAVDESDEAVLSADGKELLKETSDIPQTSESTSTVSDPDTESKGERRKRRKSDEERPADVEVYFCINSAKLLFLKRL